MTHQAAVCGGVLAVLPVASTLAATLVELQVSRAGAEDWHEAIQAVSGESLDVRVRVSFTGGPVTPLGLAQFIFEPTVSLWRPGGDVMRPLVNAGQGGQYTTPIGAVTDAPGQYGRVIPYALVGFSETNALTGHINNVGGVNYLRIAQAQVTSWFGGSGNTSGGSGINLRQLNVNSPGRDVLTGVPFSYALTNLVVFKFGLTLDPADTSVRTMAVDIPLEGIYQQPNPVVGWYRTPDEVLSGIEDRPTVQGASIFVNVPAPGAWGLALLALPCGRRRRTCRLPR